MHEMQRSKRLEYIVYLSTKDYSVVVYQDSLNVWSMGQLMYSILYRYLKMFCYFQLKQYISIKIYFKTFIMSTFFKHVSIFRWW